MLTPDEEKKIKSLEKEIDKVSNSDKEPYMKGGLERDIQRKIDKIRQRGYGRDEHPNMGLPKGSLYYIDYDD